jgi:hypothetical protein
MRRWMSLMAPVMALACFSVHAAHAAQADAGENVVKDSTNGWGYGYDSLLSDLSVWRADSNVRIDSIGASVQHRALWMVSITAPGDSLGPGGALPERKHRVFIHARTHPSEVQAFWAAREAIRFLLSDEKKAKQMRRDFIFNIIPMYNPDGVELGKARENAHSVDLESNWDNDPMEPEPTALKKTFMAFMAGPIPIEVALNLHADQYNCSRFFFYHLPKGTSAGYAALERNFIGGVQPYFPGGIRDWDFEQSWPNGTVTHYPEGFWWVNHGDKVMALTFEDNNSLTPIGSQCPPASGFDTTAMALVLGSADYIQSRMLAPIVARASPVTRMLLKGEGILIPPGGPRVGNWPTCAGAAWPRALWGAKEVCSLGGICRRLPSASYPLALNPGPPSGLSCLRASAASLSGSRGLAVFASAARCGT